MAVRTDIDALEAELSDRLTEILGVRSVIF